MTLATLLKSARQKAKLTLRDAAAQSGVSNPLISQLETGHTKNPAFWTVRKLAKLYRISPLDLFSVKE